MVRLGLSKILWLSSCGEYSDHRTIVVRFGRVCPEKPQQCRLSGVTEALPQTRPPKVGRPRSSDRHPTSPMACHGASRTLPWLERGVSGIKEDSAKAVYAELSSFPTHRNKPGHHEGDDPSGIRLASYVDQWIALSGVSRLALRKLGAP